MSRSFLRVGLICGAVCSLFFGAKNASALQPAFTNGFEGTAQVNAWTYGPGTGHDSNGTYALDGSGDGWINPSPDKSWHGLTTGLPTLPGQTCNVTVWIRTSSPTFGTGYIGVMRQNLQGLGQTVGPFGSWPGDPSHKNYNHVDLTFTAVETWEIFNIGFWGNGSSNPAWMQIDDLNMQCQAQFTASASDNAAGVDIAYSGQGFAAGHAVYLEYYNVPGKSGPTSGTFENANSSYAISGTDTTMERGSLIYCSTAQLNGTVTVVATDTSTGNSGTTTIPAYHWCTN